MEDERVSQFHKGLKAQVWIIDQMEIFLHSVLWLDQFLTLALDAWILSKFSTLYWICLLLVFLILVGVELPLCL